MLPSADPCHKRDSLQRLARVRPHEHRRYGCRTICSVVEGSVITVWLAVDRESARRVCRTEESAPNTADAGTARLRAQTATHETRVMPTILDQSSRRHPQVRARASRRSGGSFAEQDDPCCAEVDTRVERLCCPGDVPSSLPVTKKTRDFRRSKQTDLLHHTL